MLNGRLHASHFAIALAATQLFTLPGTAAALAPPEAETWPDGPRAIEVNILEEPGLTLVSLRAHREDLAYVAEALLGAVRFLAGPSELGDLVLL